MQFYNPTGDQLEIKAFGKEYTFDKFSEEIVWDPDHQKFIQTTHAYLGIVPLDYEEEAKRQSLKKFPAPNQDGERQDFFKKTKSDSGFQAKYKKEQSLKGLKNVESHYLYLYNNEMKIDAEIESKKGKANLERFHLKSDHFLNKIEEVRGWIKDLETEKKKTN